jgi:hypothetical protein
MREGERELLFVILKTRQTGPIYRLHIGTWLVLFKRLKKPKL